MTRTDWVSRTGEVNTLDEFDDLDDVRGGPEFVGDLDLEREVVKISTGSPKIHLPDHVDECGHLPAPGYARRSKAKVQFDDLEICKECQRAERDARLADVG